MKIIALKGAESKNAETEYINLYDLNYKGCISCFECKRLGGKSYGKCAVKDELTPVLEKMIGADAVVLGSPIYLADVTGAMRNLLERFIYQYIEFSKGENYYNSLVPKKIKIGLIYTMGATEEQAKQEGFLNGLNNMVDFMTPIFDPPKVLTSYDTFQFDDHSKYQIGGINVVDKIKHREEQFPIDCQNAFDMGIELVTI